MSGPSDTDEGILQQTNSELSKALRSCRAVVDSYRALLSSETGQDLPGAAAVPAPDLDDEARAQD